MRTFLAACAIMAAMACSAQATIIGQYLTFDGNLDVIVDESYGTYSGDLDAPGIGDIIQGVFRVGKINNQQIDTDNTILGIYSLELTGLTAGGEAIFTAIDGSGMTPDDNSILGILASLGLSEPATYRQGSVATDATMMLLEVDASYDIPDYDLASMVTTISDTGGPGDATAGWEVTMIMGLVDTDDFHQVDVLQAGGGQGAEAEYRLAYTVIEDAFGASTKYLEVPAADFGTYGSVVADFASTNETNFLNWSDSGTSFPDDWHFGDDGNFYINAVPEPGALAVWAVLAGFGVILLRRRK